MNPLSHGIHRRTILRGLGAGLALPWLESLAFASGTKSTALPPKRLAVLFMGNGVEPQNWGGQMVDGTLQLHDTLRPLEPFKEKLAILEGLRHESAAGTREAHLTKMNVLAGMPVKKSTSEVELGVSFDQFAASHLGNRTRLPSLVIGTEAPRYRIENGYTQLYLGHCSWTDANTPTPKEIHPQVVFDRLFGQSLEARGSKSVLDFVRQEAKSVQGRLGRRDQEKLDEYFTSIRELETRIAQSREQSLRETEGTGWQPFVKKPTLDRPGDAIPTETREHLELMMDLWVLAFQMDRTRIATFMMNDDLSMMDCGFIPGVTGALHTISHHSNKDHKREIYQKVNEWHVGLMARALEKLAATDEGGTSLLENSQVMFCSSLHDGNRHDASRLPVLVAGGDLPGGQLLDFTESEDRRLCRLYVSMLNRLGCPVTEFGDADCGLPGWG